MQLRTLNAGVRLAITALVLTLLLGQGSSVLHMVWYYQNRDERPAFTLDDLRASYHGIDTPSLLRTSLERGHPETLPAPDRKALLDWLAGGKIAENYDSLDLGVAAPAEIIAKNCVSCHAANAADPEGRKIPLQYWEEVKNVAFDKKVNPKPVNILAITTHTHALALGTLSIVLVGLACLTRWRRTTLGVLCGLHGVGLFTDIAAWWLARLNSEFVYAIVVGGGVYQATLTILAAAVVLDLWLPRRTKD